MWLFLFFYFRIWYAPCVRHCSSEFTQILQKECTYSVVMQPQAIFRFVKKIAKLCHFFYFDFCSSDTLHRIRSNLTGKKYIKCNCATYSLIEQGILQVKKPWNTGDHPFTDGSSCCKSALLLSKSPNSLAV